MKWNYKNVCVCERLCLGVYCEWTNNRGYSEGVWSKWFPVQTVPIENKQKKKPKGRIQILKIKQKKLKPIGVLFFSIFRWNKCAIFIRIILWIIKCMYKCLLKKITSFLSSLQSEILENNYTVSFIKTFIWLFSLFFYKSLPSRIKWINN